MDGSQFVERGIVDLSALIPFDARVVLEVGTVRDGSGGFIRGRNPNAFLVRVIDDTAREKASIGDADRLLVSTSPIPSIPPSSISPGSVDCLVIAASWSGILAPEDLLDAASRALCPGGILLGWSIEHSGLAARWISMFERNGLTLVEIEPWVPGSSPFDDASPARPIVPPELPGPVILRAVKSRSRPRGMAIQTLAATPICSRVRTEQPGMALRTIPRVRTRTDSDAAPLLDRQDGTDRILIRQRNILRRDHLEEQRILRKAGYLVICEWDDDPAIFPEIAANDHLTFRSYHCVQTSTEPLAEVLRAYHPVVRVFRNEIAELPPPREPKAEGPVTILFAALNRESDWPAILPGIRRVLEGHPDRVRVEVLHDRAFFDALPAIEKRFRPFLPYDEYLKVLRSCDVALLPLAPSRFNRCKSDLKSIECAANGVVCLASDTVYSGTIRHESTGLIFRSASEFESLFRRLIRDDALRCMLQRSAYRHVARHRMLGSWYRDRYLWYREMCERLDELDRALCDRVPELR
jgi:hypothetical protein